MGAYFSRVATVSLSVLALSMSFATAQAASPGQSSPVLFTAQLNLGQVTHPLFRVGDTKAPQPFYKNVCSKRRSMPYNHADGFAVMWFNPKTDVLKYAIAYANLSGGPIMAHFHVAKSGQSGPIVQTICGRPPANSKSLGYSSPALSGHVCPSANNGFITGTYKIAGNSKIKLSKAAEIKALWNGQLYLNFHTCLNELGEVRGQVYRYQRIVCVLDG